MPSKEGSLDMVFGWTPSAVLGQAQEGWAPWFSRAVPGLVLNRTQPAGAQCCSALCIPLAKNQLFQCRSALHPFCPFLTGVCVFFSPSNRVTLRLPLLLGSLHRASLSPSRPLIEPCPPTLSRQALLPEALPREQRDFLCVGPTGQEVR